MAATTLVPASGGGGDGGDGGPCPGACERRLSHREIEVLALVAAGLTNRQVAESLYMSHHTVAHHLAEMLRRFGAHSRGELIARAYASQIFTVGIWPPCPTGNNRMLYSDLVI